jgi:hypothetical protein
VIEKKNVGYPRRLPMECFKLLISNDLGPQPTKNNLRFPYHTPFEGSVIAT